MGEALVGRDTEKVKSKRRNQKERKRKKKQREKGQITPEMEIEPLFHLKKEREDLGCQQVTQLGCCVRMREWVGSNGWLPGDQKQKYVKNAQEVQSVICRGETC